MEPPSQEERDYFIDLTNKDYLRFAIPEWMSNYDRGVWMVEFKNLLSYIKADSSPGVPLALVGATNGVVIKELGDELIECVLDRVERLLSYSLDEIEGMSRKERIDNNLVDPVRCFVKSEPHKVEKVREGRMRLIASVSLIDKLIEMALHRVLHKTEIQNWLHIPSKPGIGFSKEMNDDVYESVMEHCKVEDQAYTDISGWDWSVKEYMIRDCAEGEIRLCYNASDVWKHLVRAEAIKESQTVYQFSDGVMVALNYNGVVNSGKYKTSRGNSWMRVYLAHSIGAKFCIAAGDDSVESWVDGAQAKYALKGFTIKDYQRVETGFEFCSRWYQEGSSFPLNADKMLMNLLHSRIETEEQFYMALLQFTDMMEYHPEFPAYADLLETIGFVSSQGRREPK